MTNLLKDKRQLWKQLLVRPFDKEDISFHLITFIYRACSTPWRFRVNQPGVGSRTWCPQLAWGEIYLCLKKKRFFTYDINSGSQIFAHPCTWDFCLQEPSVDLLDQRNPEKYLNSDIVLLQQAILVTLN